MNAVEIEEAVSALAIAPFSASEFPFAFLAAFGNKETAIQRLRAGSTNASDIPGGVLQRNNIHLATCEPGKVGDTLTALKASPKNAKGRPKFVLATDGIDLEAEELATGEVIACTYPAFADHFGFFLPLAGISTVAEIKNNPIDIKATSRLNKLYVELLKENPDWGTAGRRQELNQFMARLIFCFFAEDTGIFNHVGMFTACIKQMTAADSSNTHEVITELFRVMDTKPEDRETKAAKKWAREFPYVNGGLFTHKVDSPRFSKIARSYLIRAGELDWKQINPDIFGSMIQAVADDDERGELGMHYTSVPNILKVLDPLFLDDLRDELEKAEDNPRKLLNLRKRIASIRVFDPACGSGNFLVIAYIKMREIEAEIVKRRGEHTDKHAQKSWIKLTNFYGIEIKSFAAEVARLSLLIAEFQSNVRLIGQREACLDVLPLNDTGHIHTGNALRLDWLEVCPPRKSVSAVEEDLGGPTGRLALDERSNNETYLVGNPPYIGDKFQSPAHKEDLKAALKGAISSNAIDYIVGWFWKAAAYATGDIKFAFVSTNSISQGVQVPILWPPIFARGLEIFFAHRSFPWANNAAHNAKVICVIVGIRPRQTGSKSLFWDDQRKVVTNINAYLVDGPDVIVQKHSQPIAGLPTMVAGNISRDEGNFMLSPEERNELLAKHPAAETLCRRIVGSRDFIDSIERFCLWIEDEQAEFANTIPTVQARLSKIKEHRETGSDRGKLGIDTPHRFERTITGLKHQIVVPRVSSERRKYLPAGLLDSRTIISDAAQAIYDPPLYVFAVISSRLHLAWIATTAGRMKQDYRYSSGVCYNSFPLPKLTETQQFELTRCAEDILLAREHYWPATIADMYDPERMDSEFPLVRQAHEKNDETLERIYIGRRFKNDTERLEKLFDMYTKMTAAEAAKAPKKAGRKPKSSDESPAA